MNGLNERYYDIANSMNTGLTIYFEGKCNKKFYANFNIFKKYTLLNGNSCYNIIKKVENNNNCIGIIDGDNNGIILFLLSFLKLIFILLKI